jgi:mannose-6-phosphate isomerase-like protein (cupin superfamily)
MAVTLEGGCRVSDMREGGPVAQGAVRIWNQIGKSTGAHAISLRVMEFAPGLSPRIRNGNCDELLYVLDKFENIDHHGAESAGYDSQGQARSATPLVHERNKDSHPEGVRLDGREIQLIIDGKPFNISADTGVYIRPNQTFAIDNAGPHSVIIVSVRCPDPDRVQEFVDPTDTFDCPDSQKSFVRLWDRAPESTADRWYRVLVDKELGSEQVTQFVGSIPPGRAPDHFHTYEEVLFILKGEGRMWAGETNTEIGVGSCIYLPKGQVHCVENTGTGELRLLGVFYPAGSPSVRYEA